MMKEIVSPLIEWYACHKKDLPWRREPTPYHVWISEIMLQQTRIEAAIPYYERFIREIPDVRVLAEIDDDTLMKLWQGLGYYSRARNLKAAAKLICAIHGGELPREAAQLRKLPGIGAYTAGAIASIAYGEPEPAVDGNVLRVIMRLCACGDDVLSSKTRDRVASELREIYPAGKDAGMLTEGLMELGEVVCIPNGEPHCDICPVRAHCRAYAGGLTSELPVRSAPKQRRIEERTVLLMRCGDKYALRRRAAKGLLAGLWEFPSLDGKASQTAVEQAARDFGLTVVSSAPCGNAKHIFSHVEWHMSGYFVECAEESGTFLWKSTAEIRDHYAVPTAFRFYSSLLSDWD